MERSTTITTVRTAGLTAIDLSPVGAAPETTLLDATTSPRPARLGHPMVESRQMSVDGVAFVHQRFHGPSPLGPPAALLQHFPGETGEWDPTALPYSSRARELILMEHPHGPVEAGIDDRDLGPLARRCLDFIDVLQLAEVDLLGFSLGVRPPEDVVLLSPRLVQRLIAASHEARATRLAGRTVTDITSDHTRKERHT